jgi:hypothetical protein
MKIKEVLLTVTECIVLVAIIGFLTWFAVSKTSNTYEEEAIIMEAGSSSGSNTFTITYFGNGATSGKVTSHTCKKNSKCTIKSNGFKRVGYAFAGWTTKSNGSNDGYKWTGFSGIWKFTNGQKGISNNKLKLYAMWKKTNYVITKDSTYKNYPNKVVCDSSTLKYRILNYKGQYLVLVWVKDPVKQLNNALASGNAKGVATGEAILGNEIKKNGYSKKCLVAVNSSFFNNQTSWGGVVIHKGKVVKNTGVTSSTVIGVNKNGTLTSYSQMKAKDLVDSGVRNTFVASSLASADSTRLLSNRTQICQIDKNNFVIYSGYGTVKAPAADITKLTGCKNVYNLDGGGSRKLYYKTRNQELKRAFGGDRKIPEMLYFVEQ